MLDPKDVVIAYNPGGTYAAVFVKGQRVRVQDTDEVTEWLLEELGITQEFNFYLHPQGKHRWEDAYRTLDELYEHGNRPN